MSGWPRPHKGSPPTETQARLLSFMKHHLVRFHRLPTHREMEQFLGSEGVGGVLEGLVTRGLITRTGRKYVGYKLAGVSVRLVGTVNTISEMHGEARRSIPALIREWMQDADLPIKAAATVLGVSRRHLSNVLNRPDLVSIRYLIRVQRAVEKQRAQD